MSTAAALGEPGDYTLAWQAVSADGHPISGEVPFSWDPATPLEVSAGSTTAPECGATADDGASETPAAEGDVSSDSEPDAQGEG
ncbi:copper resistance protein CopC, partial [Rhizobium johnstonii]